MNGRESVSSFRSMEILSPEPPRELNIPVDDCEDTVRSSGDRKSRRSKSGKEKKSFESEEDQKLKRGLAKIQSNDLTLVELRARQMQIREETETLRKENAEGFYKLRHLLGKKGVSVLEDLYFKEYPDLVQQLEAGSSSEQGKFRDDSGSQRTPRDLISASSSESNMTDVDERIFYQTEVLEEGAQAVPTKVESLLGEEEDEELARLLERSEKRANFIERNKELAASGDILTKNERDRLEAILATEDEEEKNTDTEIRLAQINTELENKFSSTALVPVNIEDSRSEKRLREIDSRLSFLQSQASLRTGSTQLLAIKDVEDGEDSAREPRSDDITKMLEEFQMELERMSTVSASEADHESLSHFELEEAISEEQIQELLASAKQELNLS